MRIPLRPWLYLAPILALTIACYLPGLHGPFLFDDFANLPTLELLRHGDRFDALVAYLTSGRADPTGRPVALLTFLADAAHWPDDAFAFKRTNLIVHLANGALLHALLLRLGRRLDLAPPRALQAALFGTACWLLHPLLVSTTLYVVQREAMLSTTFVFAGLVAFDEARRADGTRRSTCAWALYVLCLALATLSKANGLLLPLLAFAIEAVVPAASQRRGAMRMLVGVPALAVVAMLAVVGIRSLAQGVLPHRGWSTAQRLMTEPRVLLDYLGSLWLPRPYTAGLFNDDVAVSTSLLQPATTLPAIAVVVALLVLAWRCRGRMPAWSLAIAFFFVGHLMESTVIPLELFFEHRNYLPAALMFWPLGVALAHAPRAAAPWRIALLTGLPLLLAVLTWMGAGLWGDPLGQARLWATMKPDSPRAQAYAANVELGHGRADAARERLAAALARHPDQPQLALSLVDADCASGHDIHAARDAALHALRTSHTVGAMEFNWLTAAIGSRSGCAGADVAFLDAAIRAMQANPVGQRVPGRRQDTAQLAGMLALRDGRPREAVRLFDAALHADPRPAAALEQAAELARAGHVCDARDFLARARPVIEARPPMQASMQAIHAWWLWHNGYWASEARHLHRQLELDTRDGRCDARPAP